MSPPNITDYMHYTGSHYINNTRCNIWGTSIKVPVAVPPYQFIQSFGYAVSADDDAPVQIGCSVYDPTEGTLEDINVDILRYQVLEKIDDSIFSIPELCFRSGRSGKTAARARTTKTASIALPGMFSLTRASAIDKR